MARMTVTQLKHACVDRSWREAWLVDRATPLPAPTFPQGHVSAKSRVFHQICADFSNWLTSAGGRHGGAGCVTRDELWGGLWDQFAKDEVMKVLAEKGRDAPLSADHLVRCLKAWCQKLAEARAAHADFRGWSSLILTSEFSLTNVELPTSGGGGVTVGGRPDAVHTQVKHGVVVIDYKLSRGANLKHDLVQLAIYSRLLSHAKPGLKFAGRLEYYEPELHVVEQSAEELARVFDAVVQPVLDEIAGYGKKQKIEIEGAEGGQRDLSGPIRAAYQSFKVDVEVVGRSEAPQLFRYQIRPGKGVPFNKLRSHAVNLKIHLGLHHAPMISAAAGCVILDVEKDKPDTVLLQDVMARRDIAGHSGLAAFVVGVNTENQLMVADLADSNSSHVLVAGVSGSGKSEFLKAMVASLILRNTPETLRLSLIDPKMLTFGGLSGSRFFTQPVMHDIEEALAALKSAADDMDARYEVLMQDHYTKLSERIADGKRDIPYHVLVFDEFADLINSGSDHKKEFERLVKRIAAKGRAAGVHLVIATQRPDRDIVTGQIKANLPLKVCLRVTNTTNSQIVLDEPGAEMLLGRGDLLFKGEGKNMVRAQAPFVPQREFLKILAG